MVTADVDPGLDRWCLRWLGSAVSRILFEAGSQSRVTGVNLDDGRDVVVKVRPCTARLAAVHAVHRHVWEHGFPAPEPLVAPTPFDSTNCASAEQFVAEDDEVCDGSTDAVRSARTLAALIGVTASAGDVGSLAPAPSWVAWDHDGPGLWPPVDVGAVDLNATDGPDWLDDVARRCRARLARHRAPRVVGHADWHADNVRWSGDSLLVVHDWDSVVCQPESVIVGIALSTFPASRSAWHHASLDEGERFLTAYVAARQGPWTSDDTQAAWAASLWTLAVDAKEATLTGADPDLTEAEALERLRLACA